MKLLKVKIKNFKSIKEIEFEYPESGILVLVGENNAGKSNIIRALDLICGESWIGKDKLENHDYYLRDTSLDLQIVLYFDNKRSVRFKPDEGKWGITYFTDWSQTTKMPFTSNIKEDFPSTYLGADRTLDKHLSFYDWTLIGRIRKAFHKNVTSENKNKLNQKFSELIEIFDTVPGFVDFKNDFTNNYKTLLPEFKTNLQVDFQPFTPSNYFKTMQIMGTDPAFTDVPVDLNELGEGARNLILISLLQSFAKNFKGTDGSLSGILALEEPELFLHPQARRHLFSVLRTIARNGMQVIISTHSDSFIDTEYFDEIGRVVKIEDDENEERLQTKLITCSKQRLIDHCIETGVPASKVSMENITEFYRTTSNVKLNEGFFAKHLILVEGETEELAIPELLREYDIDCDSQGISIIPVQGKNQIPKYWRLYSQFEIPITIIIDSDNSDGKEKSNKNIADCFDLKIDDIISNIEIINLIELEAFPNTRLLVLDLDFENAFEKDLAKHNYNTKFQQFEGEAKDLIKPLKNQQKGVIARYIVRKSLRLPNFNSRIGEVIAETLRIEY